MEFRKGFDLHEDTNIYYKKNYHSLSVNGFYGVHSNRISFLFWNVLKLLTACNSNNFPESALEDGLSLKNKVL